MLPSPPQLKPDFGVDAPGIVALFVVGGGSAAIIGAVIWRLGDSLPGFWQALAPLLLWPGLTFCLTGLVMLWGSKVGKLRVRQRILNQLNLQGHEVVLDVGCGRGLMLLGVASRLTTGRAVGIDLWQTQDQSGNAITTTEENARRAAVAEKVELHTGNMCDLPFDSHRFDAVVSSWAIHNVPDSAGRKKALTEIIRVLKPGGRLVIVDISYTSEYQKVLEELHCPGIHRAGPYFTFFIPSYELWASAPNPA